MRLIPLLLLLAPTMCRAEYKLNPYTNQRDYYESPSAVAASTGTLAARVTALEQAGVGSSTIAVNTSQFSGNGAISNPLNINTSSITAQGNSFNAANKLLMLDGTGFISSALLPVDGYSSTYVNVGEAIPGSVVDLSTVTAALSGKLSNTATIPAGLVDLSTVTTALSAKVPYTGATSLVSLGSYGLVTSSDVVAHAYYGDGSHLTGISGGGSGVALSFTNDTFLGTGSQTAYTLSQSPYANSLNVYKNGVQMYQDRDYTLAGQVFTFFTAPANGANLDAKYAVAMATDIAKVSMDGAPIGSWLAYGSTTAPAGYLYADGTWLSTTTYSDLFKVVGYTYSTFTVTGAMFQLPDGRSMFQRGADPYNASGLGYSVIGSTQTDTFQGHKHLIHGMPWHDYPGGYSGGSWYGDPGWKPELSSDEMLVNGAYGTPRISSETRPRNIAVAWMIKYANIGTASVYLSSANIILAGNNTWTGTQVFSGPAFFTSTMTPVQLATTSVILASDNTWTGTNTFSGTTSFSNAASTVTFSGWIDIGWQRNSTVCNGASTCSLSCPVGTKILSGGCSAAATMRESIQFPDDGRTWKCTYASPENIFVDVICARIK